MLLKGYFSRPLPLFLHSHRFTKGARNWAASWEECLEITNHSRRSSFRSSSGPERRIDFVIVVDCKMSSPPAWSKETKIDWKSFLFVNIRYFFLFFPFLSLTSSSSKIRVFIILSDRNSARKTCARNEKKDSSCVV